MEDQNIQATRTERALRNLVFHVVRLNSGSINVLKVKFRDQEFYHLFSNSKQPLIRHIPTVQERVTARLRNVYGFRDVTITLSRYELRCYFNTNTRIFIFRGTRLRSEREIIFNALTAESRQIDATRRRVQTRAANRLLRESREILPLDNEIYEQVANLFRRG